MAQLDWKKVKLPDGAKIFKVHNFAVMHKGATYHIEVDEFADGSFSGHGEHSTDKSTVLKTVNGRTLEDCLTSLLSSLAK